MSQATNIAQQLEMINVLRETRNGSFATVQKKSVHKMKKTGNPLASAVVVKCSSMQLQVGCNTQNIENTVAKREGREPRTIGPLPWGEYVNGLPIIKHKGCMYIRGHWVKSLSTSYTVDGQPATDEQIETIKRFTSSRPLDSRTPMTIKLENVQRLTANGQTVNA